MPAVMVTMLLKLVVIKCWLMMLVGMLASHVQALSPHLQHGEVQMEDWKMSLENKYCTAESGSCYNTGQCCQGYICSTFDDVYPGDRTEAPGVCIKAKELRPCASSAECGAGSQCVTLGKSSYCQVSTTYADVHQQKHEWTKHMYREEQGGLGSACENDSQCKPFTLDGVDKLCCQDVRRGRQGTKRMCDRVNQLSICISKRG